MSAARPQAMPKPRPWLMRFHTLAVMESCTRAGGLHGAEAEVRDQAGTDRVYADGVAEPETGCQISDRLPRSSRHEYGAAKVGAGRPVCCLRADSVGS